MDAAARAPICGCRRREHAQPALGTVRGHRISLVDDDAYLIKWDEHNNPYPELATQVPTQANGGVSKDGLTITYHLRKGVRWSDGAPFDADDVVFSTNVVLNPATNEVGRLGWDQIAKVDEPDKFTVVF